ncbi:hypothetical protein Clacol_009858 [Clathrus columnatus]|uniref:Large ribosomal subunit protein uL6 alpha-beta domain-containing protein n=1 Tax=Clathrus columnatus TaxID=1419009 RepID=A0AAV5AUM6_9AGAM|nr:hypothetical protein Clacol_009858 [Clathrus columnatus]
MRPRLRTFIREYGRLFSTSLPKYGHPCYIGRAPILIPPSVVFVQKPNALQVTGPLGTTDVPIRHFMELTFKNTPGSSSQSLKGKEKESSSGANSTLYLTVHNPDIREQRCLWGLTRTLISNAITGMTEGFVVPLFLVGVGYRAALEPDPRPAAIIEKEGGVSKGAMRLNLKLGFAKAASVYIPVPPHIQAEVPVPARIMLFCTDKQKLGLFAAKIRNLRKPEPYKGKGIFVGTEVIRIKSVKKK